MGHWGKVDLSFKRLILVAWLVLAELGCSSSAKQPLESRAIWVQCDAAGTPEEADEVLDRVVRGGFDTVLFCVGSGVVNYKSSLLTWSPSVTSEYDPLAYVVEQAHARGLKTQAWWSPGLAMTYGPLRDAHPEWDVAAVDGIPDSFHWLNFSRPEVRQFVGDVVLEIAENYDVDGVHLDYIRYFAPPPHGPVDPAEYFGSADVPATVQSAYQRLKAARSDVQITAAVMAGQGGSTNHLQSWADRLAGGYIDYVMPMAYLGPGESGQLKRYLREWRALPHFERIMPGLSVEFSISSGKIDSKTADTLADQIEMCQAAGVRGIAVFDESAITDELIEALVSDSSSPRVLRWGWFEKALRQLGIVSGATD